MYDEAEATFFKIDNLLKGTEELTDKFDIETVLLAIQDMNKKIEFLKELKKRRTQSIDEQVASITTNIEILENSIANCMNLHKEKTLDFPGIGKVQVRKAKGSWQISDENALYSYLTLNNMDVGIIENVSKINKKELNKLLNKLEENNNIPKCVFKEADSQSLSVSFVKEESSTKTAAKTVNNPISSSHDFDQIVI
jgi:hypothetical protein